MRDHVRMEPGKWSTRKYSADSRARLGIAHRRARQAAGFPYRPAYGEATGIAVRSIVNLERGDPVGEYVIEAVGRYLPGWTEDTAKQILEGGEVPALSDASATPQPDDQMSTIFTANTNDPRFWAALRNEVPEWTYSELWALYLAVKRNHHPE